MQQKEVGIPDPAIKCGRSRGFKKKKNPLRPKDFHPLALFFCCQFPFHCFSSCWTILCVQTAQNRACRTLRWQIITQFLTLPRHFSLTFACFFDRKGLKLYGCGLLNVHEHFFMLICVRSVLGIHLNHYFSWRDDSVLWICGGCVKLSRKNDCQWCRRLGFFCYSLGLPKLKMAFRS